MTWNFITSLWWWRWWTSHWRWFCSWRLFEKKKRKYCQIVV